MTHFKIKTCFTYFIHSLLFIMNCCSYRYHWVLQQHIIWWKHSLAVISSPWMRTTLLHYTTPLHCKNSFVPTVKLLARRSSFLLWFSQSLKKKKPKHYVHLKIILSFLFYFLLLTEWVFFSFLQGRQEMQIDKKYQEGVADKYESRKYRAKLTFWHQFCLLGLHETRLDTGVFLWERIVRKPGSEKRRGWQ